MNNKTKTIIFDRNYPDNTQKSQPKFNKNAEMHHQTIATATKTHQNNDQAENKKKIKHYPLNSVPLSHANYLYSNNLNMNTTTDKLMDFPILRNKSSIEKRTPADVRFSKNISMVLEKLLQHYENSYLPTHGQGI